LVLLGLAYLSTALHIGQCGAPLITPCEHIDVEVSFDALRADFADGEAVYVMDLKFDDWDLHYVTAIEQMYDANCLGNCGVLPELNMHPVHCTMGVADVRLTTYDVLPTFSEDVRVLDTPLEDRDGDIAVVLFPGDRAVNFNYGDGSFVRFGGDTAKAYGRIAVRVLDYPDWEDGARSVTLRFHIACADSVPTTSVYTGYITARAYPEALLYPLNVPQTRMGRVSVDSIKALLKREEVDSIWLQSVGVFGRDWLSTATLYKIDSTGHKEVIAVTGNSAVTTNIWNSPHLNDVHVELRAGDLLQWTCEFDSTLAPPLPSVVEVTEDIASGDSFFVNYACDIAAVFANSRCGSAYFDPSTTVPRDCLDPLFVPPPEDETVAEELLVYDYTWLKGDCSDGSQWKTSAQRCTDQYDGGRCAFCVGRGNNMESRTCIDRMGMDCNEIFNSPERKSWCNMEFECTGSSLAVPVIVLILAMVALFF
jgi:hypothetical protein